MNNPFNNETKETLENIYKEIKNSKEEGLRPRILDSYIQEVRSVYSLSVSEGWKFTEQLFLEEVAKRYFESEL